MTGRCGWMAALLLTLACHAPAARAWSASVTRVTDGDTLWVRPAAGGKPIKIRINGIDAPEICQAYGPAARAALSKRLQGRRIELHTRRKDDYGRTVATLHVDGEDIGGWMVSQGHAWSYAFGRDHGKYAAQEARSREAALGLFADRQRWSPSYFAGAMGPATAHFQTRSQGAFTSYMQLRTD